jgi:hypothetical protein
MIVPDIEEGAWWTVLENDRTGPIIVLREPFPERLRPNTVSDDGQIAPAAEFAVDRVTAQ